MRWFAVCAVAAVVAATGCHSPAPRHYFTLSAQVPAVRFARPYPVKLRVAELEMRRTYRRDELVTRADVHELTFLRRQRWSEPPQRMITGVIREHLRRSGIALEVQDESTISDPDFVLGGEIEAIEQVTLGDRHFAHLAMTYRLRRFKDDQMVWDFRIDAQRPVSGTSMRSTIGTLSAILASETDRALVDLAKYFADPSAPRGRALAARPAQKDRPPAPGWIAPDDTSPLNNLDELLRDDTPMPVGFGAIFAPGLADGHREPLVGVYRNGRLVVGKGRLGKRIIVRPGDYEVRLGSGAGNQQMSVWVRVEDGKTTIVPPTWAALDVAVVDETFVPFRGTYEIIRMDTREDFGLGFGADEQLGELTRVWVLRPGLYKIIRSGGTYRDRTDFATVRLEAGRLTRFTLVQDPVDGRFLGAGEADPDLADQADGAISAWRLRAVLGGDFNLRRSDQVGDQDGWRVSYRAFFDGAARWMSGPHGWNTQFELEEGRTRLPSQDIFLSDTDRLFFHTIYTYQLLSWFGPYARAGLETKLLLRHAAFETPQDVVVLDEDGMPVRTLMGVSRVKLGSTFAPFQMREGTGANFRALRTRFAELDLRVGFGARQTIANGLYVFQEGETDADPDVIIPVVDSSIEGVEATIVGLGRITRFVTVSTELDSLVPLWGEDLAVVTWRNQVNIRLASFLSLNYRFNLSRDPNLGIGDDVRTEHDLQLRFSWVLF
jgi:ABC-type uncharacterized transport system auxiliary subunit